MRSILGRIPFFMDLRNSLLIAELTGCFRGREEIAFGLLERHVHQVAPRGKALLAFSDQIRQLGGRVGDYDVHAVEPALDRQESVQRLIRIIDQHLQNVAPGVEIDLVSFVGELEEPFIATCGRRQLTARFTKWGELFHPKGQTVSDESVAIQATGLSRDQIVEALRQAMEMYPGGIRLTGLRKYLKPMEKFSREANPATAYSGFITGIVSVGVKAGVVHVEGVTSRGTAAILPRQRSAVESVSGGQAPEPSPAESSEAGSVEKLAPAETEKRRVDVFLEVLRSVNFGPFSRDRKILFQALEAAATTGNYTPSALIKAVIESSKRDSARKTKLPWGIVEKFFYTVLGRMPVLIGQEGEILRPNSVESLGKLVKKLADGYAARIEKEMLYVLVEKLEDVKPGDMSDLGFVLYPDRPEAEGLATVESLLGELQADGDISKEGEYFKAIRKASGE